MATVGLGFSAPPLSARARSADRRTAPACAFYTFCAARPRDGCAVTFNGRAQVENRGSVRLGHGDSIARREVAREIFVVIKPPSVDSGQEKILRALGS